MLAGGADVSDEPGVLGGVLDCIELSVLGAAVSEPVACCREQAAASVSALRHRINKPRFMGGSSLSWDSNSPVARFTRVYGYNAPWIAVFRPLKEELWRVSGGQRPFWRAGQGRWCTYATTSVPASKAALMLELRPITPANGAGDTFIASMGAS